MVEISTVNANYLTGISDKLQEINNQLKDLPSVLTPENIEKFQNGEYDITLEEYTDMNTYRTTMSALYGSSSANGFNSTIGKFLGLSDGHKISAKEFMENLEEKGVSKNTALKLYSALKTYSSMAYLISGQRSGFVSAKI